MMLPVQHKDDHLGAAPPVIILKAINTGLNADYLRLHNTYAYTITRTLVHTIQETFGQQRAHGLFLWKIGSQKKEIVIDIYFRERCDAQAAGILQTPSMAQDCAFVYSSHRLEEYLQQAVRATKLEYLEVISAPPYAYIGDPQNLSVSPPERFYTIPNTQRHGLRFNVKYLPTGDEFPLICSYSPSSSQWDNLTPTKKQIVFDVCMQQAGAKLRHATTHDTQQDGAQPPTWILCGDLNTSADALHTWKMNYKNKK